MVRKKPHQEPSGYTILVIDDQEEILFSIRLLLEREGHRVLTAASGQQALALFRPGRVHLVVVDYFMPGMNGEEVVQEIRRRDKEVQILLMTGYPGQKPPREMLRSLDIQGYHDKGESRDRLLLWVDVALKACAQLKKIRETEQEVAGSQAQLRHLLHLQEEERERVSRDLHDRLGQLLTAIGMDVGWAHNHCPENLAPVCQRLQEAASLVQEAIEVTRELCATLRPERLSGLRLEAALREYIAEFEQRSGLPIHFSTHLPEGEIPPQIVTNLYHIVQEALNNVVRHATATKVTVDLRRTEQGLRVSVVDNGKGFEVAKVLDSQALGLVGMQERARLVGGRLEVCSAPGAGTCMRVEVPIAVGGGRYD